MRKMKIEACIKKIALLMIVLGLIYAGITSVFGVQGVTDVSVGASSRANFSDASTVSVDVQAGNVTELNISGTAITNHWAGFFGEISGTMTLETSDGNVFYNWSGLSDVSGEVFASTDNTVTWSGIGCATAGEITAIETALGIAATDADTIGLTYSSIAHPAFDVGVVTGITGCNSTNTYVNNGVKDPTTFYQILLTDTNGDAVYTTLINETTQGFDGNNHDFQLLVGESDAAGVTPLYFYIELN
jgi:hypothetical protein